MDTNSKVDFIIIGGNDLTPEQQKDLKSFLNLLCIGINNIMQDYENKNKKDHAKGQKKPGKTTN